MLFAAGIAGVLHRFECLSTLHSTSKSDRGIVTAGFISWCPKCGGKKAAVVGCGSQGSPTCAPREDAIRGRIKAAQQESLHTCEVCGQPGKRREEVD
jgi:hypothetical protein